MLFACVPPFDSIFILLLTGFITTLLALRVRGGPPDASVDPAARKPITPRALVLAGLYILLITVLIAGLLALGLVFGLWGA